MMDWGNTGWAAGEWIVMWTLMIVFWGGLIALALWAVRRMGSDLRRAPAERADMLPAERFARGEIDGDEFARSRELLHTSDAVPS